VTRALANGMSAKTTGTVKFGLNPARPPKLTKRIHEWLAAQPDQPSTLAIFHPRMVSLGPPPGVPKAVEGKRQITLQIDADILDYFQRTGRTYRARINRVLRSYADTRRSGNANRTSLDRGRLHPSCEREPRRLD
jgi:uncharacterized protein (DUF4415 family)